jgi:hypothetical protein
MARTGPAMTRRKDRYQPLAASASQPKTLKRVPRESRSTSLRRVPRRPDRPCSDVRAARHGHLICIWRIHVRKHLRKTIERAAYVSRAHAIRSAMSTIGLSWSDSLPQPRRHESTLPRSTDQRSWKSKDRRCAT